MRVYCETYGCTMNRGDAELMLGQLAAAGHEVVPSPAKADAIIVNTCAVKGTTYRRMLRRLKELRNSNGKRVVVAGCLPLIDLASIEQIGVFAGIVSCRSVGEIAGVFERIAREEQNVRTLTQALCEKPTMPKLRSSEVSAIVAICEGCTSNCSYCSVKFARGKLHSFDTRSILSEVEATINAGYREILLTAQDTAAYGLDTGANLPELLNSITSLEDKFKIRIGMMNPRNVKPILPELLDAYDNEKIYKFLHLPVQSGDDGVLEAMRRGYTVENFMKIVDAFRERFEDLYLTTDVIVGFPGEGEREFMHTCELIEKARPDKVNLTRFSPMPATDAARMPQVNGREMAGRSRLLSAKCCAIGHEQNKRYIGRVVEGLVTGPGKKGGHTVRLPNYKPAIINNAGPGEFVNVKIIEARPTYLLGVKT
ncbi:MAG: tRNA (N(6)-L-threonylcarbamoyladenosine(37)-C(2))-methylthiotransferase [Hadesarchaea archaeon]|nr:MAG: tRNA (N(6)-L-threonylcarbamoyladenosine(37)-C(2))-methylthiotransferase [Hadesarchaea archaeon]